MPKILKLNNCCIFFQKKKTKNISGTKNAISNHKKSPNSIAWAFCIMDNVLLHNQEF